jgi:hypothetical protein
MERWEPVIETRSSGVIQCGHLSEASPLQAGRRQFGPARDDRVGFQHAPVRRVVSLRHGPLEATLAH